jgi:hypothetical protein
MRRSRRHDPKYCDLGHEDQGATWFRRERRSDGARAVLGADDEHAEHADRQLGEEKAGEAGAGRIEGSPSNH